MKKIIAGVLLAGLALWVMAALDLHMAHGRPVHLVEDGIEPHYRP